jgi:Cytochrome c554 and c-prime
MRQSVWSRRWRALNLRSPLRIVASVALAAAAGSAMAGSADAPTNGDKHLGVATCASSVCHGKISAQVGKNVALNEYTVWSQNDHHSQAYNHLKSPAAVQMAAKLGLPSAVGAKICLDCHADNVPRSMQGPKFRLTDGIGCEACHGGSEKWIETHTQTSATHKANLDRGMYPSEQPLKRATLCLSCHYGSADRFATHAIMGAGHPRLSFELEAYTENQPAHFIVDEDYLRRKGKIEEMNLWVTGQLENEERYLTLLQSGLFASTAIFPEFAFYDCFGCHHANENNLRWSRGRAGPGAIPGMPRLQKEHLLTLQALAAVIAPSAAAELTSGGEELVHAGQTGVPNVRSAAQKLLERLRGYEPWARRAYSAGEIAGVRKALLRVAADDHASDFASAEQIVQGVDSLSDALHERDRRKSALDALFDKVNGPNNFNATQFADTARRVQAQF